MRQEFTFRIAGSYSPADIPLERLGEYLEALAELLGDKANVHFGGLAEGSTIVRALVDHAAVPKVEKRVRNLAAGEGPTVAIKAFERLDSMLREDNATGELLGGQDNIIRVDFPGRNRPEPVSYGPIKQFGTIDGEVFRVEGRDATVHVGIMDGPRIYALEAPAGMGQQLASLFRSGPVRFRGEGTWYRPRPGTWELKRFKIDSFEELDRAALAEAFERLRAIGPGDWADVPDALDKLRDERDSGDQKH